MFEVIQHPLKGNDFVVVARPHHQTIEKQWF